MNCFVKEVLILNNIGEKRRVSLFPGLNIITGDSKTGKSALIEIVDYCLCSRVSNIPQGVISEFASLFCIVLKFASKQLVIGRMSYWSGGATKMYFKVENAEFEPNNLTASYFAEQSPIQLKQAQLEIERHLGLSVTNMSEGNEGEMSDNKKASLRDMTSFLFQHQNLIANKHSLLYRFDDYRKRQSVIDSFPVFSGWANDNYFLLKRQKESKEREFKLINNRANSNDRFLKSLENELKGYIKSYYYLIEKPFDEQRSVQSYINNRQEILPDRSAIYVGGGIDDQYSRLTSLFEANKVAIAALSKKIKGLEDSESYAVGFQMSLSDIQSRFLGNPLKDTTYECPTCGKEHPELNQEIEALALSNERMQDELSQISTYAVSYAKEIEQLSIQRESLRRENSLISKQVADIENTFEIIQNQKNVSNAIVYAKAQLDLRIELFKENAKDINSEFTARAVELQSEIDFINTQLNQYNIGRFFAFAETELSSDLNRIGNKLDFEEQLKPLNLWFDLKTFNLTHEYKDVGLISLSEMGSGANWLTCHLALCLGLLKWFAYNSKSTVPSFLFLDQPSQVYFPKEFDATKDEDIKQVSAVFTTILEELESIKDVVGYTPQVIVTDHADNLKLKGYEFNDYVRKRWTPDNDGALI
ncbi:DUF3732 domain-containing protein [Hymenobacter chitinivorans]|uniref:AAA domain-containing protein n=1 Tax=Hymenobacter chitinivorans DSM 11115 TaxID=1121954 RepID=A0A2M9ASX1_9BACT|nr:DUF3732 domain-containing protein [Hymenobacter chitinivorans]PJJ48811.1 AAA domain-containing protein [Hymenobacter chitinivorans DSM 11115]